MVLAETQIEILGDRRVTISLDSIASVSRPKLKHVYTMTIRTTDRISYEIYFRRQAAAQAEWLAVFRARGLKLGDEYFPSVLKAYVAGLLLVGMVIGAAFVIYGLVTDKPGSSNISRLFLVGLFTLLLIVTAIIPASARKK